MQKKITDFTPQVMREFGDLIKSLLPPGVGFSLVFFEMGKAEGLTEFKYISNGNREDLLTAFEALVLKWKNSKQINNN